MAKTFRDVIDDFPLTPAEEAARKTKSEAVAAALGMNLETVRKWRQRKSIPPEYWFPLTQAVEQRGGLLTADELAAIAASAQETAA